MFATSVQTRREFLKSATVSTLAAGCGLGLNHGGTALGSNDLIPEFPPLQTFAGKPRDRGQNYGERYRDAIQQFLDKELYASFVQGTVSKDQLLRYADACGDSVKAHSQELYDELEGIAQGAAIELEEVVLITLHEELYHRGALPKVPHCTALAVGPPFTKNSETLVGQTWDWMQSVVGLSRVVHWQRDKGPSVLAYGFPGMFCGAGMNTAGLALCWTSAGIADQVLGVRVGIPSYVLLTHLLYQETLDDVISESRRATNAGWFTFVMADGDGRLLNVEGSPKGIVVEPVVKILARVGYGSREMTGSSPEQPVALHPRCEKSCRYMDVHSGQVDAQRMQVLFEDPQYEINVGKSTIDMMVFDTTKRVAWLSRGPSYRVAWQKFEFPA
jgi:isopenicillin-N N-acyltransferase-like protein